MPSGPGARNNAPGAISNVLVPSGLKDEADVPTHHRTRRSPGLARSPVQPVAEGVAGPALPRNHPTHTRPEIKHFPLTTEATTGGTFPHLHYLERVSPETRSAF